MLQTLMIENLPRAFEIIEEMRMEDNEWGEEALLWHAGYRSESRQGRALLEACLSMGPNDLPVWVCGPLMYLLAPALRLPSQLGSSCGLDLWELLFPPSRCSLEIGFVS